MNINRIKKRCIIIALVILIIVALPMVYLFYTNPALKPGPVVDIDENAITIRQLLPYVTKYMDDYKNTPEGRRMGFSKSDFHYGRVDATLDKNQRCSIIFSLVETTAKNSRKVFSITVDTNQHKILSIEEDESRYGNPNSLNIENWKVDSDQAIDKAIKYLEDSKTTPQYDKIHLLAWVTIIADEPDSFYPCWRVVLIDSTQSPELSYSVPNVDPYTGEFLQGTP